VHLNLFNVARQVVMHVPQERPELALNQIGIQPLQLIGDIPHVCQDAPQLDQPAL
jgi:hypothetical protein